MTINSKLEMFRDGTPYFQGSIIAGVVETTTHWMKPAGEQTLDMSHRLCSSNPLGLDIYMKVMRHEFLHVFGLMHTQTRQDRDDYVKVDYGNLLNDGISQYAKCRDCKTFDAPYECNSIMHYNANSFAKDNRRPVMTPVNKKNCNINPGYYLTSWDWKLLRKAANCPGS